MPEGDTIYRAARALERALGGEIVTGFETGLAKLASVDDNAPLAGRLVERVESRGKWCLIYFSGDLILATHMLMSGSWHLYRSGERWRMARMRMRVVIRTAEWEAVGFNIPVAEFFTAHGLERSNQIPKLGPDVLSDAFTVGGGVEQLMKYARANPDAEGGQTLLNQRVLAGLGNVYKSEVAFAAGVNPFRAMRTVSRAEADKMVEFAHRYMRLNVVDGTGEGIVTYAGNRRTRHTSDRGERSWVYGRQGQECRRCGAAVMMRRQGSGARSTYWCPVCQPWVGEGEAPVGKAEVVRRGKASC